MPTVAFADESGTDERSSCYAIGVVSVAVADRQQFELRVDEIKAKHGVAEEAKWTKIRRSHGAINFILDALALIFRMETATFDVIVVKKQLYRNWNIVGGERETAFYQTYTFLLKHLAKRSKDTADVLIDSRSDRYSKRHEVVQTVGNRMLHRLASRGRLERVCKADSRGEPGIQVADVLTGAINTAHQLGVSPIVVNPAKLLAISRISYLLGWDGLHYDTWPDPKFNIWHFPQEYRGPSRVPAPRSVVPYVLPSDMPRR